LAASEKSLLKAVEEKSNELIELLRELVRTPSVGPPGDTRRAFGVLSKKLNEYKIDFEILQADESKPNIWASIGEGRPNLIYNTHVDTVPIGDRNRWTYDPFSAEIVNDRIYGRGVGDAKGSVAAMTMAAIIFNNLVTNHHGTLILNPVSDEETGSVMGTGHVLDKKRSPLDMAVVGEQTENDVAIAQRGVLQFEISIKGISAHAALPEDGASAIQIACEFVTALYQLIESRQEKKAVFLLPPVSVNVGLISGGVKANVVADNCDLTVDRRTIPGESESTVRKEMDSILTEACGKIKGSSYAIKKIYEANPVLTARDQRIVQQAQYASAQVKGEAHLVGYKQGSNARFFNDLNIPTIILGPTDPRLAHSPNEYARIKDIVDATKIYVLLAKRLLG
jgi:succinyl-diaminopimelate desuccinylase